MDEMNPQPLANNSTAPRTASGAAPGTPPIVPLTSLVTAIEPAVAPLVESLVGGWGLVQDAQAALQLLGRQRGGPRQRGDTGGGGHGVEALMGGRLRGLVTPVGEVFKADGEIVAASAPTPAPAGAAGAAAAPYGLTAQVAPMPARGSQPPADEGARQQDQQRRQQVREREAVAAQVSDLERQVAEAGKAVAKADSVLIKARDCAAWAKRRVAAAEASAAAAEAAAASLMQRSGDGGKQPGLATAKKQLLGAKQEAEARSGQERTAQQRLAGAAARLSAALDAVPGNYAAASARQAAAAAISAAEEAQAELVKARQAARRAAGQVAALKKQAVSNGAGKGGDSEAQAARLKVGFLADTDLVILAPMPCCLLHNLAAVSALTAMVIITPHCQRALMASTWTRFLQHTASHCQHVSWINPVMAVSNQAHANLSVDIASPVACCLRMLMVRLHMQRWQPSSPLSMQAWQQQRAILRRNRARSCRRSRHCRRPAWRRQQRPWR